MVLLNSIIFYDNYFEIVKYVDSVMSLPSTENLYIAVTVNKCENEDVSKINEHFRMYKNVFVYFPNCNLGYMNGLIYGYDCFVKETKIEPNYVIMSNTDIVYKDHLFFAKLNEKKYNRDVWLIGPSVYANNRKCYDNPVSYKRYKKRKLKRIIAFTSIPVVRSLYVFLSDYKARLLKRPEEKSSYVYEVHGCYFIVKNDFAKYMVEHKYGMLLYSEESYLAEEVYHNKKRTYYDSDLKIIHDEHTVTGRLKRKRIARYVSSSLKYILKTYYKE